MSQQPFVHLHDPPKHWNIKQFITSRQPFPIIIIIIITTSIIISSSWMSVSAMMEFCFFVFNGKAPGEDFQKQALITVRKQKENIS